MVYAYDAGGGAACCGEGGDSSRGRDCAVVRDVHMAQSAATYSRDFVLKGVLNEAEFCINNEKQIKRIKEMNPTYSTRSSSRPHQPLCRVSHRRTIRVEGGNCHEINFP